MRRFIPCCWYSRKSEVVEQNVTSMTLHSSSDRGAWFFQSQKCILYLDYFYLHVWSHSACSFHFCHLALIELSLSCLVVLVFFKPNLQLAAAPASFHRSVHKCRTNEKKELQANIYLTRCSALLIPQTIPRALSHLYQRERSKSCQVSSLDNPAWHKQLPFISDINSVKWDSVFNMLLCF